MSDAIQQEVRGRLATAEETALVQWADRASVNALPAARDALRQMVTLSTALVAGSAALIGGLAANPACKVLGTVLMLACLGASLLGSLPHTLGGVNVTDLGELRDAHDRFVARKMAFLWVSVGCLFCGLAVLLAGALIGK